MVVGALLDEKKALMDKKKALMDKKKALMDEKNVYLTEEAEERKRNKDQFNRSGT